MGPILCFNGSKHMLMQRARSFIALTSGFKTKASYCTVLLLCVSDYSVKVDPYLGPF